MQFEQKEEEKEIVGFALDPESYATFKGIDWHHPSVHGITDDFEVWFDDENKVLYTNNLDDFCTYNILCQSDLGFDAGGLHINDYGLELERAYDNFLEAEEIDVDPKVVKKLMAADESR